FAHFFEAIATIDRPSLRRMERYRGLNFTDRTFDFNFYMRSSSAPAIRAPHSFVLQLFACSATFWLVAETSVCKKELFPGRESKFLTAFNAYELFVFVFYVFDHGKPSLKSGGGPSA